jgi:hypothetical protein
MKDYLKKSIFVSLTLLLMSCGQTEKIIERTAYLHAHGMPSK